MILNNVMGNTNVKKKLLKGGQYLLLQLLEM